MNTGEKHIKFYYNFKKMFCQVILWTISPLNPRIRPFKMRGARLQRLQRQESSEKYHSGGQTDGPTNKPTDKLTDRRLRRTTVAAAAAAAAGGRHKREKKRVRD